MGPVVVMRHRHQLWFVHQLGNQRLNPAVINDGHRVDEDEHVALGNRWRFEAWRRMAVVTARAIHFYLRADIYLYT